jgi:hypothetical protein
MCADEKKLSIFTLLGMIEKKSLLLFCVSLPNVVCIKTPFQANTFPSFTIYSRLFFLALPHIIDCRSHSAHKCANRKKREEAKKKYSIPFLSFFTSRGAKRKEAKNANERE